MSEQIGHANPDEELRFQYDKLRSEILHNDVLSVQSLAAILLLIGAITGYAFSDKVTPTIPITAFFAASIIISFIGLKQNSERIRGTFIIASYLRIFMEGHTKHLRWETRLQKFRDNEPYYSYTRYSAYLNSYVVIALLNSFLIIWYLCMAYQKQGYTNPPNDFLKFFGQNIRFVCFSLLGIGFTAWMTWFANKMNKLNIKLSIATFDKAWKKILMHERLQLLQDALQNYRNKKGQAAQDLTDLVAEKYIPEIPVDPFTDKHDWIEIREAEGGIINVKSKSRIAAERPHLAQKKRNW